MDRQTVRRQTGAEVSHRPGISGRLQPSASRSSRRTAKSPSQASSAQTSSSHTAPSHTAPSMRQRKRAHPPWLLFVFGLWVVSLASAVLATRSLLDPTASSNPVASSPAAQPTIAETVPLLPAPLAADPASEQTAPSALPGAALDDRYFYQSPETGHLPLVALGSIAVSCAMGCILVSRALYPRRSPPRLQYRSGKPASGQSTAAKLQAQTNQQSQEPPATKRFPAATAPQSSPSPAQSIQPARIVHQPADESKAATPASVTVLPADQTVPLDWEEPSLADSLDLRQRHSLRF